ncbi:FliA/WhiG family RNA polymerase sigma factor [Erwinia tracheiphila]|uniref:Flagellar biosynthesis sigma factor n=1 Tax=Erwinia tracheiphila TaxID=65700 RepID=A0A0M2KEY2_9GAMM|nr:FliA/WhiG family RNA polymerase sigma factor [Erwinia tracheiphila]AXF78402.1 FliA/WhiG family RNA polymerase sigma factor [Erwinia tracheiphila]EOS95773.1 flagellar biosynthesis sigma factor [Erwinia tracheiphila PSU-1]KKF37454.1 flagellar biosynthesis sigma factor [Erwinia tracheiphila]UIA82868.1 FliA/WhiG family RNA polymerase sigma factor [Erwinia tracheiphila]UIA88853.1 FliA/WhiG family RNA polymerase sigma factor [Erwinia tracheiphila]
MAQQEILNELLPLTQTEESHYVQQWLPLVKRIVRQLSPQANSMIGLEDIEQIALMGLLESLRRYGKPDEQFAGYAAQRIRGAVLDQFRLHDWRPRSLRQKTHKANDAIRDMSRSLGREPTPQEVCEQLKMSVEDYQEHLLLDTASTMESLDLLLSGEGMDGIIAGRRLEDEIEIQRTLTKAIDSLDEREKVILSLYYKQGLSLKEIAIILDLTQARVCQLNKRISEKIMMFF